ncbi:MAG: hypothetical protein M1816_001971 [Peltula sp. TS41687]|nr:MAG: hypothetical protein M1816_001971 [Peltula sp. TS41687]
MLLQVWVLPTTQPTGAEQISSASQAPIAPAGSRGFLESCPADITLEQLCTRICARHDRIYPDKAPLKIKKLQDFYTLDLDLDYVVADIFKDRDSGTPLSSIVKVTQTQPTRESSVPLESALRPHRLSAYGRKRARAESDSEADTFNRFIKREAGGIDGSRYRERRTVKRRRLQEISRSSSPTSDQDRPLPSREREIEQKERPNGSTNTHGHRERHDSPGHMAEYSQYGQAESSQARRKFDLNLMLELVSLTAMAIIDDASNRARGATPSMRLHRQRVPALSPIIIPDSPVLGFGKQHDIPTLPPDITEREAEVYGRQESPPSMDELPVSKPSTIRNAARDPKGNTKTSDQIERFRSLPPPSLARTSKLEIQQSPRHSSVGPRPLMAPNTSGDMLAAKSGTSRLEIPQSSGHSSVGPKALITPNISGEMLAKSGTSRLEIPQSSRHSSVGPKTLITPNTSQGMFAKSSAEKTGPAVTLEKNASTGLNQDHQFIKPQPISKHADPIKSDSSHTVNVNAENKSDTGTTTMNGVNQVKDLYEFDGFDGFDHTNLVQRPQDEREHDVTHKKQSQAQKQSDAQKQPAPENNKPAKPQLARRGTLPEAWLNAGKKGKTDKGTTVQKLAKNDKSSQISAESSGNVSKQTGRNVRVARAKEEPTRARAGAPKVEQKRSILKLSQEWQTEVTEETRKEWQQRRNDYEESLKRLVKERGGYFSQSEPKQVNAKPKSTEEKVAEEPEGNKRKAETVQQQKNPNEERENKRTRTWYPTEEEMKKKANEVDKEQEERNALEAAKLQLKEKNDRISKEWEERKAAKPTQDQIIAATNSVAGRGPQEAKPYSSTPFFPRGIRSKGINLEPIPGVANMPMEEPKGLDALAATAPRSVKRTVSFVDQVKATSEKSDQRRDSEHSTSHIKSGGAGGNSTSSTRRNAYVPRRYISPSSYFREVAPAKTDYQPVVEPEAIKKQTPIYPPGMGPEDLRPPSGTTEAAKSLMAKPQNTGQGSSHLPPARTSTQTTLEPSEDAKGKGKATAIPTQALITKPREEIIISDDDQDAISISSYYSSGSNKSAGVSEAKKDTSKPGDQMSQLVNTGEGDISTQVDQAPSVSTEPRIEVPRSEPGSPKEVDPQAKPTTKVVSSSSSLAFQTQQLEVEIVAYDISTVEPLVSTSAPVASAASGSEAPYKDITAQDEEGTDSASVSSSASNASSPPDGVTAHGKSGSKSQSESRSISVSASSGASAVGSKSRSPARYLSCTPQSDTGRGEVEASQSQRGSPSPAAAEEESKSASRQDLDGPETSTANGTKQVPTAVEEKHVSASPAEEKDEDEDDLAEPSPSPPEHEQDLNEYLQRNALQSSQPTYPVSSQVMTDQKATRTGNDKKTSSSNQQSDTYPQITAPYTTTKRKKNRTRPRIEPFNMKLSRQLTSQLKRTITRHKLPASLRSKSRASRVSKKALKLTTQPDSDSAEDDAEEEEEEEQEASESAESQQFNGTFHKKTANGTADTEEVEEADEVEEVEEEEEVANLTPPSAQPPRRVPRTKEQQQNQTPKQPRRRQAATTTKPAIRGSILATPKSSSGGRKVRGNDTNTITSINTAGAGNAPASVTESAGKVAGRFSGLLSTLNPWSSSMH